MDLIKTLNGELNNKNYTELEIVRYIYVRVCEIFHFDSKWYFPENTGDLDYEYDIIHRKIDLENLDNTGVVCHTISEKVLAPLIRMFTDLEVEVVSCVNHSYVHVTDYYGRVWKLDPSYGDMARAKLGIELEHMKMVDPLEPDCTDIMDLELGFSFVSRDHYNKMVDKGQSLTSLAKDVGNLLYTTRAKRHFTDVTFFLDSFDRLFSLSPTSVLDEDLNWHRMLKIENEGTFFETKKENGIYVVRQVDEDRFNYVCKELIYKKD